MIEPLERLLQDVLTDGGLHCELTSSPVACDAVIVMVTWGEELLMIAEARREAGDIPLLAILPFFDDEMAQRVLLGGAQDWFALDAPLALLRESLVKLAGLGSPPVKDAA